nr:leucine-rich repeat receptor-like tyrosine-protein kinase PXC3 [Ipomoea batatas]
MGRSATVSSDLPKETNFKPTGTSTSIAIGWLKGACFPYHVALFHLDIFREMFSWIHFRPLVGSRISRASGPIRGTQHQCCLWTHLVIIHPGMIYSFGVVLLRDPSQQTAVDEAFATKGIDLVKGSGGGAAEGDTRQGSSFSRADYDDLFAL